MIYLSPFEEAGNELNSRSILATVLSTIAT
jgi:hypothetical protein